MNQEMLRKINCLGGDRLRKILVEMEVESNLVSHLMSKYERICSLHGGAAGNFVFVMELDSKLAEGLLKVLEG